MVELVNKYELSIDFEPYANRAYSQPLEIDYQDCRLGEVILSQQGADVPVRLSHWRTVYGRLAD
jgi:hypothetical protein